MLLQRATVAATGAPTRPVSSPCLATIDTLQRA